MLPAYAADIVRATIPMVAEHHTEITKKYYELMATRHPVTLRAFDHGLHAAAVDREAMMSAVLHFARVQVDAVAAAAAGGPPVPMPGLSPVVAFYRASGMTPDQVLISARVLSRAFTQALGDRATPEIVRQWDQVLWLFATSSIADDVMRYQHSGVPDDVVWRPWSVVRRDEQVVDTVSFTLQPADGGSVPGFAPGQYTAVGVTLPDGARRLRHYTLTRAPDGDGVRITVRRLRGENGAPDGEVSSYLHDSVAVGDVLDLGPFVGDVTLDTSMVPLILISAGVGITYTAALLDHVARNQPDRPVISVHADRSPGSHALMNEIASGAALLTSFRQFTWYEEPDPDSAEDSPEDSPGDTVKDTLGVAAKAPEQAQHRFGRVRVDDLPVTLTAQIYLCGPLAFMNEIRTGLIRMGHNPHRIHYEIFGPDQWARHRFEEAPLIPEQHRHDPQEGKTAAVKSSEPIPDPAWSW